MRMMLLELSINSLGRTKALQGFPVPSGFWKRNRICSISDMSSDLDGPDDKRGMVHVTSFP